MRSEFSAIETQWLSNPPRSLARVATVDPAGMPHVIPCGWSYDPDTQEIVLGGRNVLGTRRAKHVESTGRAAVVIDGLSSGPGWSPWALQVRGRARLDVAEGTIRVSCDEVTSWGLEQNTRETQ